MLGYKVSNMSKKSNPRTTMEEIPKCLKFLKNSSKNTIKSYFQAIWKYEEFHNMSIEDLVNEALTEQCNNTPMHQLTIIDRIEEFQEELIQKGLVYGTIKNHVSRIKSVYYKNRVTIPYIEPLNPKKTKSITVSIISPSICHEEMGPDAKNLVFQMLGFNVELVCVNVNHLVVSSSL